MKLDTARVDETRSLLGDDAFAKFLRRLEDEMQAFIAWLNEEPAPQSDEVGPRCHMLASSAGLYGARDLRVALLTAEETAKSDNPAELAVVTSRLAGIWSETRQEFRELD